MYEMEMAFISIHDLSRDARVRYASSAIEDILGYQPHEIVNKSVWDYIHPREVSQAKTNHSRLVRHDKVAGLNYFQAKHKHGFWVKCECIFTVVYDVLVVNTRVYKKDIRSQMRAADAPIIRRLFASSSRDPRYHMLSYMSTKFAQQPRTPSREPRAAFILNRFTRSSNIIYATSSVTDILGVTPSQLISKSFYYCIEECCLHQAVQCLESAKANDSIAYLRFWFRNPMREGEINDDREIDERGTGGASRPGGITRVNSRHCSSLSSSSHGSSYSVSEGSDFDEMDTSMQTEEYNATPNSRSRSPSPSLSTSRIEIEAVVSCSSDGLLVVIRRARPPIPGSVQEPGHPVYANRPVASVSSVPPQATVAAPQDPGKMPSPGGPEPDDLRNTIRDVAVLAWAINGK